MNRLTKLYGIIGVFALVAVVLATLALTSSTGKTDGGKPQSFATPTPQKNVGMRLRDLVSSLGIFGGATNYDTLCLGEVVAGDVCYGWARGTMETAAGTATGTATFFNNLGVDIIVDYIEMYPTRSASSSMYVWAATSSQATTTTSDYLNPIIRKRKSGSGDSPLFTTVSGAYMEISSYLIASTSIATGTRPVIFSHGLIARDDQENPDVQSKNTINVGLAGKLDKATTSAATTTAILRATERIIFGIR